MKDLFIEKMYELSKKPYQKFIKKGKAWDINVSKLIQLGRLDLRLAEFARRVEQA